MYVTLYYATFSHVSLCQMSSVPVSIPRTPDGKKQQQKNHKRTLGVEEKTARETAREGERGAIFVWYEPPGPRIL